MVFIIFLRDWNDFAAETEFGIVLECFSEIEVGLRIFLVQKGEREKKSWTKDNLSK